MIGAARVLTIVILWLLGVGSGVIELLSDRTMVDERFSTVDEPSISASALLTTWVMTGVVLAGSAGLLLRFVVVGARTGGGWFGVPAAYFIFFLLSIWPNTVAGTQPGLPSIRMLYVGLVIAGLFSATTIRPEEVLLHLRRILLVMIYGSFLAALVAPEWAYLTDTVYTDDDEGRRLRGLYFHPNVLGPAVFTYLAVELFEPSRHRARYLHYLVAVVVLLLAQSKTAIAGALFVLCYKAIRQRSRIGNGSFASTVGQVSLAALSLFFILGVLVYINQEWFERHGFALLTLTGRFLIWAITADVWLENPWFGYGLYLWDVDFRSRYGIVAAGQAHNQFLQTLGEAGIFGFVGLVLYLAALVRAAVRCDTTSNGLSLALVSVLLIRCLTETPLRNASLFDGATFLHVVTALYIAVISRVNSKDKSPNVGKPTFAGAGG